MKKWTVIVISLILVIYGILILYALIDEANWHERVRKLEAENREIKEKSDSAFLYSVFRDLDIFEDQKLLAVSPEVRFEEGVEIPSNKPSPESIKIAYDMSELYGHTRKFEFYVKYKEEDDGTFSVFNAFAKVTCNKNSRSAHYSKYMGGDMEIKEIAEIIYKWRNSFYCSENLR
jgi:hypothetical protein